MSDLNSDSLLVVDVDGTLCPVDTLRILRLRWRMQHPLKSLQLKQWRSVSKQFEKIQLWEKVGFSCSPVHNRAVVEVIREWLSNDNKVIVVSGSASHLAEWATEGFSNVESFGSTLAINLTKKSKADFLTDNFPNCCITYIGDSPDDLHVWEKSCSAIYIRNRKLSGIEIVTKNNSVRSISNVSLLSRIFIWMKLFFSSNSSSE